MQKEEIESLAITRLSEHGKEPRDDLLVRETALTIFFNDEKVVSILCTPIDLQYLAIGYLLSQGFINGREDIKNVKEDAGQGIVWVESRKKTMSMKEIKSSQLLAPCALHEIPVYQRNMKYNRISSDIKINYSSIKELLQRMQRRCRLFKLTGGVHGCALSDIKGLFMFAEDIGRYNAIDKVFGKCLMEDIKLRDKVLLTTGRISTVILLKIMRAGIPILISRTAPTFEAVDFAKIYGITLIGFARGSRMNIYSNDWRIKQL